ncbi:MAG TPA: AAA family ATPase [Solirubrobacteraceae bacterium]|nr:AAA family ATPase [Solirubrobacteraceae bacterium]
MLISFAVENHRSIRDRVELSFVAERKPTVAGRAGLPVPGFDMELVPALALLGANGSGKSNLLDAIEYVQQAVERSQARWPADGPPPREAFQGASATPSRYELSFTAFDVVYDYRFAVGPDAIVWEALDYAPRGPKSWAKLFERQTDPSGRVMIDAGRQLKGPRAAAVAATRPNSLFLSSAAQNNHEILGGVHRVIVRGLKAGAPHDRARRGQYTQARYLGGDAEYQRRLSAFVASADLGIEGVEVREEQTDLDPAYLKLVPPGPNGEWPPRARVRTRFRHRGVGELDLSQQSAGTRAWFEWAALVLDSLDGGLVLGADELDAHLNVVLASQIVTLFQSAETNTRGAQLLFNLQDPGVITDAGLGRDQVWVVEKDEDGATTVVPVTDYSPRPELDVGRLYRHGRVGGLPVVDEPLLHAVVGREG